MKVNVDEHQQLAAAFRVSSIPAVFALRDGQLVDQFVGMLDEEQLRQWLAGFVPTEADDLLTQAVHTEAVDPVEAERLYRQVLEGDAEAAPARIGLARVLVAQDRDDEAAVIVKELERRGFLETEAEQVKSQLELRASAAEAGDLADVRQAAAANPDDFALQLRLADTLAVHRKFTEAMDLCLDLIRRDRAGIGDEARQTMVRIFDLVGPQSELVAQYRRKLATALY
jgi:putative thioredoxin